MAAPNLTDVVSLTLRAFGRMIADNISNNIPLLLAMKNKDRIRPVEGGYEIQENLSYAGGNYQRYSGYGRVDIAPVEGITAATYPIREAVVPVTMSGLEKAQNAGRAKIRDLLKTRMDNAEKAMLNGLNLDIFSNGLADNGQQITGLAAQVAVDPSTGIVGSINRASFAFWRNVAQTFANPAAANIRPAMNRVMVACTRGMDRPDVIAMDDNFYGFFNESLEEQARFAPKDSKLAKAGFAVLNYQGAEVIAAGGHGGNAPANRAYFLNTDYLSFRPMSGMNMEFGDAVTPVDQNAIVKPLYWMGNLCASNLSLQGVLTPA